MNKEILISATDLKKYFPVHKFMSGKQYVKAVDGVSLEINKGETFGLVGESGCGKSTLERTLIRMYDITDGKVTYKGKDITNEKAKNLQWMKDEVQIIFQDPYSALNPFWNVREIINEPLKKAGMEERVIYSSFNHYSIQQMKKIVPEAETAYLYSDVILNVAEYAKNTKVDGLHPAVYHVKMADFLKEYLGSNLNVRVWTVNEKADMKWLIDAGVTAIITNNPDMAVLIKKEAEV